MSLCFLLSCLVCLVFFSVIFNFGFEGRILVLIVPLRERLRTHKVFTKYQCVYLNYHKFSIKSYVLDEF